MTDIAMSRSIAVPNWLLLGYDKSLIRSWKVSVHSPTMAPQGSAPHRPAHSADDVVAWSAVRDWMDERGVGAGDIVDATLLAGGTQNLLLRFRRGDDTYVLRRPPLNKRPNSDESIRREAALLGELATTVVPHPRLIAACLDPAVLGANFYLMSEVDGFNPKTSLPAAFEADRGFHRRLGLAMVDALLTLESVPVDRLREAGFGDPDGWLERQVERWSQRLDAWAVMAGTEPDVLLPGAVALSRVLRSTRPASWRPGLLHGDFHLSNVLVRWDRPEVAAIVDWEVATVGDPLIDLGHLLATWPDRRQAGSPATVLDLPGLPSPEELIEHYAANSARDLTHLPWYRGMACYRFAILLEGTYARSLAGLADPVVGERLHTIARSLIDQGARMVAA
ncbi:phosphotransferase family protein [Dactylosporangium sp. CA-092794]|uniref:phosphotransferase family protein n=1 Tax=Dactylosporangium sp. CA-092794 TaxID=3239929 RepID=UPI003D8A2352